MEKVGVEAVVEGLSSFLGDVGKIDGALKGLAPSGNLITRVFEGVTGALGSLGREILNVAEFALGQLLAGAIQFVVEKFGELISSTIQAGAEFQILSLRLNQLNMNSLAEQGLNYTDAMDAATEATREQLQWVQRLAIATPYDASDIANVFTLARSYGFADQMARDLTGTVTDFTASMGLGDIEMRRILKNFGQMIQLGKITQRELNDLAVGALVPVNDVLARMRENTGKTGSAFDDLKSSGEGVQEFFKAFSQIIEERASGAAAAMARTFSGATDNAKDFAQSILGFNVVMPVLDLLGSKIADTLTELTNPVNFAQINNAARRLGLAFTGMLSDLLGGEGLDTGKIADALVKGLDKITIWILQHGKDVKKFFQDIGKFIQSQVVPFIMKIVDGFNMIRDWVSSNKELIGSFFTTLGEIIGSVFGDMFGGLSTGSGLEGFLQTIKDFMIYVTENKEAIIPWVEGFLKLFGILQVVGFVFGVLLNIVLAVVSPFLALAGILGGMVALFTFLGPVIAAVGAFIVTTLIPAILIGIAIFLALVAVVLMVVATLFTLWLTFNVVKAKIEELVSSASEQFSVFRDVAIEKFDEVKSTALAKVQELWDGISTRLMDIVTATKDTVSKMAAAFFTVHWGTIGRSIIEGVEGGVYKAAKALIASVVRVIQQAYEAAMNAIQAMSPSKLFANIGDYMMLGIAKGVEDTAGVAISSMEDAIGRMVMPALALPALTTMAASSTMPAVSNSMQNNYNYNLTVNSNAPTEPIVQDFNMMQSMTGI